MEPINNGLRSFVNTISTQLPGVAGALLILLIGFVVAGVLRAGLKKGLGQFRLNERLGINQPNLTDLVAGLVYAVVMIFVLVMVLSALGLRDALAPVQAMLNNVLGFIPNLLAAGVIGFVGYALANILSGLAAGATSALSGVIPQPQTQRTVTNLVRQLVFIVVFVPLLVMALNALRIDVIAAPAVQLLNTFMSFIPRLISFVIILAVFGIGGRIVTDLLANLLQNVGLDRVAARTGLTALIGGQSLVSIIKSVVYFFLLFTGILSAVEALGMPQLLDILRRIYNMAGQVLFGLVILAVGNAVANFVRQNLSTQPSANRAVANVAYYAVLLVFLAMAFKAMGIADSIVDLAFGSLVGAIAVAIALSFGLGGREAAGKQMEQWFRQLRGEA